MNVPWEDGLLNPPVGCVARLEVLRKACRAPAICWSDTPGPALPTPFGVPQGVPPNRPSARTDLDAKLPWRTHLTAEQAIGLAVIDKYFLDRVPIQLPFELQSNIP